MDDPDRISFRVEGDPVPRGSTTSTQHWKTKRIHVYDSNYTRLKPWMEAIKAEAVRHAPAAPWDGPVSVTLSFSVKRPKTGHDDLRWRAKRPDLDKLARAALDALTGIVFTDDSRVASLRCTKVYQTPRTPPGVLVDIRPLAV